MVFRTFLNIFLFRTNDKKGHLCDNNFRHCHSYFFKSLILKVTWSHMCSKFILRNCEILWQQHSESGTLQWKFLWTWINIRDNSFIKTWVNKMKQKLTKLPGILSDAQKLKPALQRPLYQKRKWHLIYFYTLLFLWKK